MIDRYQGTKPFIDQSATSFPGSNASSVVASQQLARLNHVLVVVDDHAKSGNAAVAKETFKIAAGLVATIDHVHHVAHEAYNDVASRIDASVPPKVVNPSPADDLLRSLLAKLEPLQANPDETSEQTLDRLIAGVTSGNIATDDEPTEPEESGKPKRKPKP